MLRGVVVVAVAVVVVVVAMLVLLLGVAESGAMALCGRSRRRGTRGRPGRRRRDAADATLKGGGEPLPHVRRELLNVRKSRR
jgi:uncharacterized protein HemY